MKEVMSEFKQPDWYPLRLKYRVFRSYKFGGYRPRTGNSNGIPKNRSSVKSPRHAYGPWN